MIGPSDHEYVDPQRLFATAPGTTPSAEQKSVGNPVRTANVSSPQSFQWQPQQPTAQAHSSRRNYAGGPVIPWESNPSPWGARTAAASQVSSVPHGATAPQAATVPQGATVPQVAAVPQISEVARRSTVAEQTTTSESTRNPIATKQLTRPMPIRSSVNAPVETISPAVSRGSRPEAMARTSVKLGLIESLPAPRREAPEPAREPARVASTALHQIPVLNTKIQSDFSRSADAETTNRGGDNTVHGDPVGGVPNLSLIPMTISQRQSETPSEVAASLLDQQVPSVPASSARELLGSPNSSAKEKYVLQEMQVAAPEATAASVNDAPIKIMPFNRLITAPTALPREGSLTTAAMTGPMASAVEMFGKLNIDNDFRDQPTHMPTAVRGGYDEYGNEIPWNYQEYVWVSPVFAHRPLYFEQPNLERYGVGPRRTFQPTASAAHFFGSVVIWPYKMVVQKPGECVFTLGNRRPGDCVPVQGRTFLGQRRLVTGN